MKYQHSPSVLATELADGEIVMMDADLANYFGVSDTASVIWGLFEEAASVDDVVTALLERYDVEPAVCRAETEKFVERLVERNLLTTVG